jgi:hypothetical protein
MPQSLPEKRERGRPNQRHHESAALFAVDEFAREAADRCVALHGLQTVEGEHRPSWLDAIEPLPELGIL